MLLNYHISRLVLSSLCVGDLVRLVLGGVRFAGRNIVHCTLCIRQILENKWEYSEAVHQLFIDFKQNL